MCTYQLHLQNNLILLVSSITICEISEKFPWKQRSVSTMFFYLAEAWIAYCIHIERQVFIMKVVFAPWMAIHWRIEFPMLIWLPNATLVGLNLSWCNLNSSAPVVSYTSDCQTPRCLIYVQLQVHLHNFTPLKKQTQIQFWVSFENVRSNIRKWRYACHK